MAWEVEGTDQFAEWYCNLEPVEQDAVDTAVDHLEAAGPGLGRPLVDTIEGSRYPNMKELRPGRRGLRILFAFDPRRTAILLLGGDKTNRWEEWYIEMIPIADRLYDEHLEAIEGED